MAYCFRLLLTEWFWSCTRINARARSLCGRSNHLKMWGQRYSVWCCIAWIRVHPITITVTGITLTTKTQTNRAGTKQLPPLNYRLSKSASPTGLEPMSPDFIVFGAPQIEREEIDEVVRCLESGWIGTGPRVAQFETEFAAYKGQPFAAAVGSCTAAMHLSVLAAGLREGDEVITTPLTFCATVNAIIRAGATPVLADIDAASMNIDPIEIERRITPRTKAIVPVHFAGRPCDMKSITAIAERHRLRIIEDCAHAIETEYHGRKAGTFGDFGCFSFYATKNVTTGEGGMVLTRNENELARIRMLALHGMSKDAWKRFSD